MVSFKQKKNNDKHHTNRGDENIYIFYMGGKFNI